MISEVIISGPEKNYIKNLLSNTSYSFKPGVNIIIGKNGTGKTTLLDIISTATLCKNSISSKLPPPFFDFSLINGIDVKADYHRTTFRYRSSQELLDMTRDENLRDNYSYILSKVILGGKSTGEKILTGLEILFGIMFSPDTDLKFPSLKDYNTRNNIPGNEFLDEPDRNLDIDNLKEIYNILSFHKPDTQIIAVIHNPILIYKLSMIKDINIIELYPGYLEDIKKFIKKKKRPKWSLFFLT